MNLLAFETSRTTVVAARSSCVIRATSNPATAGIADELSKQYFLGYTSPGKHDGRWHTIRVEIRDHSLRVRARRGYMRILDLWLGCSHSSVPRKTIKATVK